MVIFTAATVVAQTPSNAPRQRGSQQNQPTHDAAKGNTASPPPTQTPAEFRPVFQPPKWEPKNDPAQQKPGYWEEAFEPAYAANWGLVFIGGIAGFLAWKTLNSIETQAWLMKKQIDLAIAKDRPRLSVSLTLEDFIPPEEWADQEYSELAIGFEISVVNQGLTKAFDVSIYGEVVVTRDNEPPAIQQAVFVEKLSKPIDNEPIAIGISGGRKFPKVSDGNDITNGTAFMHLFGYVAYVDIFDNRCHHPFRWVWLSSEFPVDYWDEEAGENRTHWVDQSTWTEIVLPDDADPQTHRHREA
ncbi:hypothetical protein [Tunturiibacter gelidoferens]|uniref:Uncharacterized protein n=1 Tax=Tunturiibacter gelidiferens TaxID=3069689 RepID=A0ACC5NVP3_9BACT|nr:hypothetical protein [Edaphobacter lichenicola]MBB5338687.1 hypothetical protein [Edaphobacter lichenicola]